MTISLKHVGLVGLSSLHNATGHYGYPYTEVNGVVSKRWEYVRPSTSFQPMYDFAGSEVMCGRSATLPLFPVKTLKVPAGGSVVFLVSEMNSDEDGQPTVAEHLAFNDFNPRHYIYHDGPATAWMSKSTTNDLNEYDGTEPWFKIAAVGASDGMHWDYRSERHLNRMNFTIPDATPPGKYLLRAEHLNMESSTHLGQAQLYANCMHIEVTGTGNGTPGPTVHFPGAFDPKDPGLWLPTMLRNPYRPMDELKNWQGAGPTVWKG